MHACAHCITLHYITLHCIALHSVQHYRTSHYMTSIHPCTGYRQTQCHTIQHQSYIRCGFVHTHCHISIEHVPATKRVKCNFRYILSETPWTVITSELIYFIHIPNVAVAEKRWGCDMFACICIWMGLPALLYHSSSHAGRAPAAT